MTNNKGCFLCNSFQSWGEMARHRSAHLHLQANTKSIWHYVDKMKFKLAKEGKLGADYFCNLL